ncbi:hypothetical protein Efla_004663 [Eimeria flavescens]
MLQYPQQQQQPLQQQQQPYGFMSSPEGGAFGMQLGMGPAGAPAPPFASDFHQQQLQEQQQLQQPQQQQLQLPFDSSFPPADSGAPPQMLGVEGPFGSSYPPLTADQGGPSLGLCGPGLGTAASGGAPQGPPGGPAQPPPPVLSAAEVELYEQLWKEALGGGALGGPLRPAEGPPGEERLDGAAAAAFLERSGLPQETLHAIWALADPNDEGRLDATGFARACRLVAYAQQGLPLQQAAAPEAPPPPALPHFGVSASYPQAATTSPLLSGSSPPVSYALSPEELQHFVSLFVSVDPQKGAGLVGGEALKPLLSSTCVSDAELRSAWAAADTDGDGCLRCFEFAAAMGLATRRQRGLPMPLILPPELNPQHLQQQHAQLQQQQQQQQNLQQQQQQQQLLQTPQQPQQQQQLDWTSSGRAGFEAFDDSQAAADAEDTPAAEAAASEAAAADSSSSAAAAKKERKKGRSSSPRSSRRRKGKGSVHASSEDEAAAAAAAEGERRSRRSSSKARPQQQQQQEEEEEEADLGSPWGRDREWVPTEQLSDGSRDFTHRQQQKLRYELEDQEDDRLSGDEVAAALQHRRQQPQTPKRSSLYEGGRGNADSAVALLESVVECDKRLSMVVAEDTEAAADELLQLRSVAAALKKELIREKQQLAAAIDRKREFEALIFRERKALLKLQEARHALELERIGAHRDLQHYQEELLFLQQQVAAAEADLRALADTADATRLLQQQQLQQLQAVDSDRRGALENLKSAKEALAKEERQIEELKTLLQRLNREKADGRSQQAVGQEKLRQTEHDVLLQRAALDSTHAATIATLQQRVEQQQQKQQLIAELNQHTQDAWALQKLRALEGGPFSGGGPRGSSSAAAAAAASGRVWGAAEQAPRRDLKGVPSGGGGGFFLSSLADEGSSLPTSWRTFKTPSAAELPRGRGLAGAASLGIADLPAAGGGPTGGGDTRDLRRHLEGLSVDSVKSDAAFVRLQLLLPLLLLLRQQGLPALVQLLLLLLLLLLQQQLVLRATGTSLSWAVAAGTRSKLPLGSAWAAVCICLVAAAGVRRLSVAAETPSKGEAPQQQRGDATKPRRATDKNVRFAAAAAVAEAVAVTLGELSLLPCCSSSSSRGLFAVRKALSSRVPYSQAALAELRWLSSGSLAAAAAIAAAAGVLGRFVARRRAGDPTLIRGLDLTSSVFFPALTLRPLEQGGPELAEPQQQF